jgi:Tol biopolymer transport system component
MRAFVLGSFLTVVAFAQAPGIDQSLGAKSVANAEISPDGRFVAYIVQQADWDENEFVQQIWISDVSAGDRYQLTSGRKSSQSPLWSPDSKRLAFLS